MENIGARVYGYRWVVLAVFALITALIEVQWLTFAPIAREAREVYQVTAFQVDLLSLVFMAVFLVVCLPASYVIDTLGIRVGVGLGAFLTGAFSLLKAFCVNDYQMVMVAQVGLAVAQPFILNAATKVAGQWFPLNERAIAVGIATLAQFVGIIVVMIVTPLLITRGAGGLMELGPVMNLYGGVAAAGAVLTLLLLREKPPTPPEGEESDTRTSFKEGVALIFRNKDMQKVLLLFFIGLGMFNAVSTCIDQICQVKGLSVEQTGLVGGMMLIAGIVGALILPVFSDKLRKRKIFMIIAMAGMAPGLAGLTFFTDYTLLLISSFIFGFFLLGAGAPVGFQYSAEITWPAPESASQGIILLTGQISGILFIVVMNKIGMSLSMAILFGLSLLTIVLGCLMKESPLILVDGEVVKEGGEPSVARA